MKEQLSEVDDSESLSNKRLNRTRRTSPGGLTSCVLIHQISGECDFISMFMTNTEIVDGDRKTGDCGY